MTLSEIKKDTIYWVDLTRVVAIFLVVMIHVTELVINNWNSYPIQSQHIANVYDSIARMCVALFFMVSGWLLLPKSESIKEFFVKRASKVFFPFLIWSIIYLFWNCGITLGGCDSLWRSRLLFLHGTSYHFWFMYPLLGIYFLIPVLRLLIVPNKKYILWYFIGLWIIFEPVLSIAREFLDFRTNFVPPMATGTIGFFILGYLLGELTVSRRLLITAILVWVLSTIFTGIATYSLSKSIGSFSYFFYDYLSLNGIIQAAAGFIWLRGISEISSLSTQRVRFFVKKLADASFGIYLVHIIVLDVLNRRNPWVSINIDIGNPIWSIPFVTLLAFSISFLIVYSMQKIPLLKKIVP